MRIKILNHFAKGFFLANRSLDIYIIGVGLSLFSVLASLLTGSMLGKILQLVSFIAVFFSFSYYMSLPLLLTYKQQAKPLNFNSVWTVIFKNTKRTILPLILLFILLIVFFIVLLFSLLVLTIALSHPSNNQELVAATKNFLDQIGGLSPLVIILLGIFTGIFTLFAFTPIYFSVENKGFFSSMKSSVGFSLNHLNFIGFLILFGTIRFIVGTLLVRIPIEKPLMLFISTVIFEYVNLIISASMLLFYQKIHTPDDTPRVG